MRIGLMSACLALALSVTASADAWNKKTTVRVNERIEVPGTFLDPGEYVFILDNSPSNRHIVRIMNERMNHVYATMFTAAAWRLTPKDKTTLTFYELPGGQPEALKQWYWPGDYDGQEFLYPKKRAQEIATLTHSTVRTEDGVQVTEQQTAKVEETTPAPVAETEIAQNEEQVESQETEKSENVEIAENTPPPAPALQSDSAAADDNSKAENKDDETSQSSLPHTGSNLVPLAGLGLAFLAGAAGLGVVSRKRA
jgi:LPXTG-motif cell wall-anchored protein